MRERVACEKKRTVRQGACERTAKAVLAAQRSDTEAENVSWRREGTAALQLVHEKRLKNAAWAALENRRTLQLGNCCCVAACVREETEQKEAEKAGARGQKQKLQASSLSVKSFPLIFYFCFISVFNNV
ncbi:hypothetical protein ACFX2I_043528 [Malus domestica]